MQGMTPQDVFSLVAVADPRLAPDGGRVAFTLVSVDEEGNDYRSAIWMVPVDGSAEPRRFTHGPKRDANPRWSPDGTRLAFTSNRDPESKAAQLYVLPADGGEALKLTDLDEDVAELVWSPDGTRIAFTSRVRDEAYAEEDERKRAPRRITRLQYKLDSVGWTSDRRKQLFVVAADGSGGPHQVTDGDTEASSPTWSPDGTRIAFASARHEGWDTDTASDLYLVDAEGGEPERLTTTDGSCGSPSWSPDGTRIAYQYSPGILDSPRHTRIAVLDVKTRERVLLTEDLDRNCAPFPAVREPVWAGDRVLFAVEDHGNTHLYLAPADGSAPPEPVVTGDLRVTGYDLVAGAGVHVATTPTVMPELYFGDQRLTSFGETFAAEHTLATPEGFTAASADGSEVQAWVMRPVGFEEGKRYPALLNIHGGPFTQYGNGFFDEFQVYAAAGYVVLYANPRGSSGYAEAWGRAIRGPSEGGPGWGTRDYEDVMAVVDTALERFDFVDPDRVGVMGGSYGGFLTSWVVSHTDRFRAACSERAVNAWASMHGGSDYGWPFKGWIGSFLHEDPDAWLKMSPLTYAQDITTPLLVLHSENDIRCPVEQAEQLFTVLRLLGRQVEMVRFPAESHELSRSGSPVHRVMRFETILEWFDRHLKG